MNNFHPLEVVGRGSETQLQVGENLDKRFMGYIFNFMQAMSNGAYVT